MTDLMVTASESVPMMVTADGGGITVTATNLGNPTDIVITQSDMPKVMPIDRSPVINVFPGSGSFWDPSKLNDALMGALTVDQFNPELNSNLLLLNDLFLRAGYNANNLLLEMDVDRINTTSISYTDTQVQIIAADVTRLDDGISANTSLITQTSQNINLQVNSLETNLTDALDAQSARIDITDAAIEAQVLRVTDIDGVITQTQGSITVQADRISAEIVNREALTGVDGPVTENRSLVDQLAESYLIMVQGVNELTSELETATLTIEANEIRSTVMSEDYYEGKYSLSTTESITKDSFGVTVAEEDNRLYVTGFELLLHPEWTTGPDGYDFTYKEGDTVMTELTTSSVWVCLQDHVATIDNGPGSGAVGYWVRHFIRNKSEFNIHADYFSILNPNPILPPIPIFIADGGAGTVAINADLIVSGSIESANYINQLADESWYKLDPSLTTGSAIFHNMIMTFSSSSTVPGSIVKTGIDGNIITTGTIRNENDNLIIHFNANPSIIVNSDSGLVINSENGLIVNSESGIIINDGGNIQLNSSASNPATLLFRRSISGTACYMYADSTATSQMNIMPGSASASDLHIGRTDSRFDNITIVSEDSYFYSGLGGNVYTQVETHITSAAIHSAYNGITAGLYISNTSNWDTTYLQLRSMGTQIQLVSGTCAFSGLVHRLPGHTTIAALTSNVGDGYMYRSTNGTLRYRYNTGMGMYDALFFDAAGAVAV